MHAMSNGISSLGTDMYTDRQTDRQTGLKTLISHNLVNRRYKMRFRFE